MITIVRVTRRPEFSQVVGCTVYGMLPFPVMDSVTDQCYLLRYYGTDKEIITGEFSKHNGMNYVLNLYIIIIAPVCKPKLHTFIPKNSVHTPEIVHRVLFSYYEVHRYLFVKLIDLYNLFTSIS